MYAARVTRQVHALFFQATWAPRAIHCCVRKALVGEPAVASGDLAFSWSQLPIILDSPLAQRITQFYQQFRDYWSDEARAWMVRGATR